tara:strand:- start:292 stop:426 length:135 start_codon:yes stop_codon:yes gene_type:complete
LFAGDFLLYFLSFLHPKAKVVRGEVEHLVEAPAGELSEDDDSSS